MDPCCRWFRWCGGPQHSEVAGGPLPPGLAELSRIALADDGLTAALRRITDIAQRTVAQADDVSVTLVLRRLGYRSVPATI